MENEAAAHWSVIAAAASAVIALAALAYSIYSFNAQQNRAERHARANLRPILRIRTLKYLNRKAIILRNVGIGPAEITRATFSKGGVSTNAVADLFQDLPIPYWEKSINVPDGTVIPTQGESVLLLQTARHLQNADVQGRAISRDEALQILARWQAMKSGIHVRIDYQDVLGNPQASLDLTLS